MDTAAQVTVVNVDVFTNLFGRDIAPTETIRLKCAGANQYLLAKLYMNIPITVGSVTVLQDIYVANIADNMLLGLDLLLKHKVVIDLSECYLKVLDCLIPFVFMRNAANERYCVSKVSLSEKVHIPPGTVKSVKVILQAEPNKVMALQPQIDTKVLIPNCIFDSDKPIVQIVNDSDIEVNLQSDYIIGSVIEVDTVLSDYRLSNASASQEKCSVMPETKSVDLKCSKIGQSEIMQVSKETNSEKSEVRTHLQVLYDKSSEKLSENERKVLQSVLTDYEDVFAKHDLDIGCFEHFDHEIDTKDSKPIKQQMRRIPLQFEDEEEACIQKMLDAGVIQESNSDWASPPVFMRKKDGTIRYAIDYRRLNACTVKSSFSLLDIKHCISALNGSVYFSTLDMASGYYQVKIAESDRHKTAFQTRFGLFEHVRMGFGLCNTPSTFQRIIQLVLRGLTWKTVLAYLDDVVILGNCFSDHIQNLKETLDRFRTYNLKLKPKKCLLFQKEVKFLGKIVSAQGIRPNPESIQKILDWPVPHNRKELQQFLGLANYHRDHIDKFAETAVPLYKLTGSKVRQSNFQWSNEHELAFKSLKQKLTEAPLLVYPNRTDLFILDTDASKTAIGAELLQVQNGVEPVVSYGSCVLTPAQQRYCTTRRELLAIVCFTRQYRHFLLGRKFMIRTDHNSLAWLMRFRGIQGQLARWIEELSQFDMRILHRQGRKHSNADALSRIPDLLEPCDCYRAGTDLKNLKCGGCPYCTRAHHQWSRFDEEVDDVVPLSFRTPTVDQIVTAQRDDANLEHLLKFLESGKEPTEYFLMLASAETKAYWLNKEQFILRDGVLLYRYVSDDPFEPKTYKLVVPESLRQDILELAHDVPTSGHLGITKTLTKLKRNFFWYKM